MKELELGGAIISGLLPSREGRGENVSGLDDAAGGVDGV